MCFRPPSAAKNVKCSKCGMFNPSTLPKCRKCGTEIPKESAEMEIPKESAEMEKNDQ